MANFRKVRELLLTSFDDGDISQEKIRIFPTRITNILTSKGLTKVNV